MNKKGSPVFTMIFGLIILGVVAALVIIWFSNSQYRAARFVDGHVASLELDTDHDGIVDAFDKSPCVAGEEVIIGSDGMQYYVFGDVITTDAGPSCDYEAYQGFYYDLEGSGVELEMKQDIATGNQFCILPKEVCDERRAKAYKEWDEQQKNS